MSRKKFSNENTNLCQVCGEPLSPGHECDRRLLSALDGAMKGDRQVTRPALGLDERLQFGFAALHGECGDNMYR